jgi:ABC-2 type transport system permease protein
MTTYVKETSLLTWRSLRTISRVPERLLDVTVQPFVFILLFLYVFGSAIHVQGISYKDFMFPGIIGQGLAFGIMGTGTATAHDMREGVVDRFRSMPIGRLAIISGQVMGQLAEQVLGLTIYVVIGLALGWRPHFDVLHGLELFALVTLALLAFTWTGVYFGMLVRSPDAMQGVGFIIVFPLTMMAGTFVPIKDMALIPRSIAEWDPFSSFVASIRQLTQNYPSHGSLPLDHPELAMLFWSLLLLAIMLPLAMRRFSRGLAS